MIEWDFYQGILSLFSIFFLTYLSQKSIPYFDKVLLFLKNILLSTLPQSIKRFIRGRRLKNAIRLKNNRRNIAAVNFSIAKANSAYLLFIAFAVLFIFLIVGPLRTYLDMGIWVTLLAGLPVYIFESIWLTEDAKAKQLVAHAGKVRSRAR